MRSITPKAFLRRNAMGIEYQITVPKEFRSQAAKGLEEFLPALLERLDPRAKESFPNVIVHVIPEGVFLCDTLMDQTVGSEVIRGVIDLLLRFSDSVSVSEG